MNLVTDDRPRLKIERLGASTCPQAGPGGRGGEDARPECLKIERMDASLEE